MGPQLETTGLYQKAVLWTAQAADNDGNVTVGPKQEIDTRWELGKQQSRSSDSSTEQSAGRVYVDRALKVGSILWQGELIKLPAILSNLYKVTGCYETPDVKCRNVRRYVTVTKFMGRLPNAT